MTDQELLREYVNNGSEEAFCELVNRYTDMVYSACIRQIRDPQLAEDAAQSVFIALSKKASGLVRRTVISGWLLRAAKYAAVNTVKAEERRRKYEKEAGTMKGERGVSEAEKTEWGIISPCLDDALMSLNRKNREAVLLRYFQHKSLAEIGDILKVSEDAAQKRVSYSLNKLKKVFSQKGITVPSAVLGGILMDNAVQAAPSGFAGTCVQAAIGNVEAGGISAPNTISKAVIKMMMWEKMKIWAAGIITVLAAAGGFAAAVDSIHFEEGVPTAHTAEENAEPAAEGEYLPAFPGAEGFGAVSKGGRGGRVLKVTNLNPDGPGSLQWACSQEYPRIIVFEVSGVIVPPNTSKGKRWLAIKPSNITIAGQTAPGAGITVEGTYSAYRSCRNAEKDRTVSDVIVRFIRFRPRMKKWANVRGMETGPTERAIFDHISVSWAGDGCVGLGNHDAVTFQWTAVEECDIQLEGGDEPHNFAIHTGKRMDAKGRRLRSATTFHHCLLAHHSDRVPCNDGATPFDWRNNVIYNVGTGAFNGSNTVNAIGNYSVPGPGALIGQRIQLTPYTLCWSRHFMPGKRGKYHLNGDYWAERGGYAEPWRGRRYAKKVLSEPFDVPSVTTHTAEEAYELILAHAGCLPQDAVGRRTVAEVQTFTGSWGRNGPEGGIRAGFPKTEPPQDTDNDGMPDAWEKARKLDPNDPKDNSGIVPAGASPGDRHKEYTWIEYYINELADLKVAAALTRERLDRSPPEPWNEPARGLAPMYLQHVSLDEMVKVIREIGDKDNSGGTWDAWLAVQRLERMGPEAAAAVPEFIRMLRETDKPRAASFAAWSLGAIGPAAKEAVPALIEGLGKTYKNPPKIWKNFKVHGFIAWALGRMGMTAEEAVPALAKTLSEGGYWAKHKAAWALSRVGPAAEGAVNELLAALDQGPTIRFHAAHALANIGEPAVEGVVKRLSGRSTLGAARAARLLGVKAGQAVPALVRLLSNSDPIIRSAAVRALAEVDPSKAGEIAALLSDKNYGVRNNAAVALGKCGSSAEKTVPALEKVLADGKKEVSRAAVLALGNIGKTAVPSLKRALAGDDPYVRKYAARALADIGPDVSGVIEGLMSALSDKDTEVRREAVWSLGLMGPAAQKASGSLNSVRENDPDYVVRYAAGETLKRIESVGKLGSSNPVFRQIHQQINEACYIRRY